MRSTVMPAGAQVQLALEYPVGPIDGYEVGPPGPAQAHDHHVRFPVPLGHVPQLAWMGGVRFGAV